MSRKFLDIQSGIKTRIARWTDDRRAPASDQAVVIRGADFQYDATAAFVSGNLQCGRRLLPMPHGCDDGEHLPVLLLYYDPDMLEMIDANEREEAWAEQYGLLQSCRMLAHLLPTRQNAKASYGDFSAVGVQQTDFMAGEDVLLHGYLDEPGKEQFDLSSPDVTDESDSDELDLGELLRPVTSVGN